MERVIDEKDSRKLIAYLQLLFTSFTWAVSTIVTKLYIGTIPAFHLMIGRFFIGSLLLFLAAPKKVLSMKKSDLKLGLLLGIFVFGAYGLNFLGLKYTSASKSGFLAALSVLFIPIIESILRKKIPSKWTLICVSISIAGLYLISGINGGAFNIGDVITIISALSYTMYILILDRYGDDKDDFILSFVQLMVTLAISFMTAMIFEGINISLLKTALVPIIIVGVFGTGMTMFLQTKAQKVASAESVGIILLGEPLFTLILAALILKEVILLKGIIGSMLILSSLVIATVKRI